MEFRCFRLSTPRRTAVILFLTCAATAGISQFSSRVWAQDPAQQQAPSPPAPNQSSNNDPQRNPEVDAPPTKVQVTLVVVPVVVRDSSGHTVGNLQKENFQLFDNGKPVEISQFALEKAPSTNKDPSTTAAANGKSSFVVPDRFTAILFDDLHSNFGNLPQLRAAGLQFVSSALARTERLAIFTTSGKLSVDFTDDRAKLQDALIRLKPNPLPGSQINSCPSLTHYDANQIVNRHDLSTRGDAVSEVLSQCGVKDPKMALAMVEEAAERVLSVGNVQTNLVLMSLSEILDRLSSLPGQRTIVLASPSFLVSDTEHREYQVVDRAVRSHIVISTMDTRGTYSYENEVADSNVLSEFADGTGGTFFRNNNDLNEGLRRVASAPEFMYELAFAPRDLQDDGKYHHLKVKIVRAGNLSVSAREGYFAAATHSDPKQSENIAINDAVFSQNEVHDLPVTMQTQLIKNDKPSGKLNVLTIVDLRDMPHRVADGKNANDLRVVAAIFDRNGKYLGALDKKIAVRWPGENARTQTAATLTFLLDSGTYLVRLVVRDSESQHLFSQSAIVEVP